MSSERKKHVRPSWDDYFFELAHAASRRATCDRGRSGCVIVRDKRVLVTGYVGSAPGLPHCDEVGHDLRTVVYKDGSSSEHCVRTMHAERNAINQAARFGPPLEGATLYCRMTPCRDCAMAIIGVGIKEVFCERKYHAAAESEEMFRHAGIKLTYKYDEVQEYE